MNAIKIVSATMVKLLVALPCLAYAATQKVGDYLWTYRINGDSAEIYGSQYGGAVYNPTGFLTIPETLGNKPVRSIGDYAFYHCENLTGVTIPQGVTNIGDYAFEYCTKLRSLTIPNGVTSIGKTAFWNCNSMTNIVIPSSVVNIGEMAFFDCSSLRSVTLPDGLTRIRNGLFSGCTGLYSVNIPDNVTIIENTAFLNCENLGNGVPYGMIIPSGVTSIGSFAFRGTALRFIAFKGNAPTLGSYAFSNLKYGCNALVVPTSSGWGVTIPGTWNEIGIKYLCTAKFNANGGGSSTPDRYLAPGEAIGTLPIVNRTGYTLNGWYSAASGGKKISATTPISTSYTTAYVDTTYYAHWTINQYTVTFDANGGTGGTTMRQDYGSSISEPIVTREGYLFNNWSPAVASTVPASNITYVAQWVANSYTIIYDANGGSGTMAPTIATYDKGTTLASNGFTCYAKSFTGWATEAGGPVLYSAGQEVRNLTAAANGTIVLYAVWEPLSVPSAEVSSPDGTTFCGDSYTVTLSCPLDGTTIYFTTNGVTPRLSATFAYTEPIVIYGSAEIVAIAVKDGERSGYTRVTITQITPDAPVIVPADGTEFRSATCEVAISCATDGAEIYYTIDGSTPQRENGTKYTAPFTIADTATVKAVAVGGPFRSEVVTATISKRSLSLAEAAGMIELTFDTDENAPWCPIVDASAASGFAAQSGTIGMDTSTWMETSVRGVGTFSFKWRVECEMDDSGGATWDRLVVYTNAVEAARIDGVTEWQNVSFVFGDEGKHTIRWEFVKDDYDEEGVTFADNAWVSGVSWVSDDPIPAIEESSELGWALSFAQDKEKLSAKLTSVAAYKTFRTWVDGKGLGHATVAASPNAWLSYALDVPGLISKTTPIASEDVTIDAIVPSSSTSGTFDLVIGIAGAEIGTAARLAEVLDVEGAMEFDESAFSTERISFSLQRTTDGKAKATVTPVGSPSLFFMRVKVK